MKTLGIIGASGHGRVVADIAQRIGYQEIIFFDDDQRIGHCGQYPVMGQTKDILKYDCHAFVAIGNASVRSLLVEHLEQAGKYVPVLVHPNAVVAEDAQLGAGTVVVAGAVINPGARIGKGCIINTCASVDHDCTIEDYVHIAVGAHVAGTVAIGHHTWVGAGATVINNVNVCANCMVGAGAVVCEPILEEGTYIGVPARKKRV